MYSNCSRQARRLSNCWCILTRAKGPVHTNAFSKERVFVVIKNASMDSWPHYRFDTFSTVHTKTFENNTIARCDVNRTLCACFKHVPVHMTSLFFTRPFLTVHTNTMYVCVFVLIHFQERFLIDEFSMKTLSVLVWTKGLNASKGMRFNRKHIRTDGTRISLFSCLGCSSRWIYGNGPLPILLIVSATPVFLRTVVLMEHRHC